MTMRVWPSTWQSHGIVDGAADGLHDDAIITLNMFKDDPQSVRYDARVKAGKASINGVSIADRKKAQALADQIVGVPGKDHSRSNQQGDSQQRHVARCTAGVSSRHSVTARAL